MTHHNTASGYGAISLLPDDQVLTQRFHLTRQQHVALLNKQVEKQVVKVEKVKVKGDMEVEKCEMEVEEEKGHLRLLVVLGDALDDWPAIRHTVHPPSYYNYILI